MTDPRHYLVTLANSINFEYNITRQGKINMDMNNHIVKLDDDGKPFHSHGYAVVAHGDQIGSTASVSFEQRQLIEQNRRIINNYNRSTIGATYGALRAKPVVKSATNRTSMRHRSSLQQNNAKSAGPKRFNEPQARTYNPYS